MVRFRLLFFVCILSTPAVFSSSELEERTSFTIPLPSLFVRVNKSTDKVDEVFISYGSDKEGWAITNGDDRYVKSTNKRQTDHIYKEHENIAYLLSDLEAEQLNKICESFVVTLTLFDRHLEKSRWDRLLYLDGYFPAFFQGFYYVVQLARCSKDFLPPVTRIADSLFDKSLKSPKSDIRINYWQQNPAHRTKLRIVTRELIYQIGQWQAKELSNSNREPYLYTNQKFKEIYELFIRLYFNMDARGNVIVSNYSPQRRTEKSTP